jgi:hypothetical protein
MKVAILERNGYWSWSAFWGTTVPLPSRSVARDKSNTTSQNHQRDQITLGSWIMTLLEADQSSPIKTPTNLDFESGTVSKCVTLLWL